MSENPFAALRAELAAVAEEEEFAIDGKSLRDLDAGLFEASLYRDLLVGSNYRDRYSAHRALHVVVRFLQAHDRWRALSIPLAGLEAALLDLDRGHVAPMLRPCGDADGRPVSWYETTLRGYAAGVMGGLMKHAGMPKTPAAEWVSAKLRGTQRDIAASTVIDWRKKALNPKRHADLYRAYRVALDQPDWSEPIACAEHLIAKIIELQTQKGG